VRYFMILLTSAGEIISGAVQPSRSYSAMHCSAKPLYRGRRCRRPRPSSSTRASELVAAEVRALVELVAAAELAADRVPHQLHELDLVSAA
jgi:hypothetical protein